MEHSELKAKLLKNEDNMSREELVRVLESIDVLEKQLQEQAELAVNADPFWHYVPSSGDLDPEAKGFLSEYLRPEDIPQRLAGQIDVHTCLTPIIGASGGNQCLGGETEIYDPVLKQFLRVDKIRNEFHVLAWDGSKLVIAKAEVPFQKTVDDLYEFKFSNGESVIASMGHLVLSRTGYRAFSELTQGAELFQPESNLAPVQKVHGVSDPNFYEKAQDFLSDCLACFHFYGGRLQWASSNGRDVFPLSADVPEHRALVSLRQDALGYRSVDTHSYQYGLRLSNPGVLGRYVDRGVDFVYQTACILLKLVYQLFLVFRQSLDALIHQLQPISGLIRWAKRFFSRVSLKYPLVVISVTYKRRDVKWDFTVPRYHNYFLSGAIHHNSGKSTTGAIEGLIKTTGQLPVALEGIYPKQKLPTKFPQHVRVIGEDYVNGILLNLIPTYRKWVPRDFLYGGTWEKSFSSEKSVLTLGRKGQLTGTIEFMSNKQDVGSFQGPPRHKMIYDEEPRRDIRQENLLRFTTAESLDELYCMTPTKGMTWIYQELFQKFIDNTGDVSWFQLPSVGNKKASLKVLREIMKNIEDYDTRKMRLLGEFISLSGLIYGRMFDRRIHVVPPFELNADWIVFRGLDPHTAKPSVCVEVGVNREGKFVVAGTYKKAVDTEELKRDLAGRARERHYRLGWTRCDKSANTKNVLLQDQNIFKLLSQGNNAIPALFESQKFTGSIHAGVDVMKTLLKVGLDGKPGLVIMDLPENKELITSFQSLERDSYPNEDERGLKDKIAEGKHDAHAALRYVFQGTPRWIPPTDIVPEPEPVSDLTGY